MTPLTQYGRMAEKHWREFLPRMVRELQSKGRLHEALMEAEEKTKDEMVVLRTDLMGQGLTADQAHRQAWELVREKYILLPPEE
jgi:glucose-6-phosphate-specific signal transduction histidine kinase